MHGVLIAESIVEIKANSKGLAQSWAVLAVNVSNHDITVTDNAMLGRLIKYDSANVISESFLCNVEDNIRSEHNLTTNDGGGRKPSSINCSSDFCEDSTTYKSMQLKNKMDNLRANEDNVADNVCGKKADAASSPSGACETIDKDNRRKLGLADIIIEKKDFGDDLVKLLNDFSGMS